jgi:hypothetical protein
VLVPVICAFHLQPKPSEHFLSVNLDVSLVLEWSGSPKVCNGGGCLLKLPLQAPLVRKDVLQLRDVRLQRLSARVLRVELGHVVFCH